LYTDKDVPVVEGTPDADNEANIIVVGYKAPKTPEGVDDNDIDKNVGDDDNNIDKNKWVLNTQDKIRKKLLYVG